jgi:hypothetical protein
VTAMTPEGISRLGSLFRHLVDAAACEPAPYRSYGHPSRGESERYKHLAIPGTGISATASAAIPVNRAVEVA